MIPTATGVILADGKSGEVVSSFDCLVDPQLVATQNAPFLGSNKMTSHPQHSPSQPAAVGSRGGVSEQWLYIHSGKSQERLGYYDHVQPLSHRSKPSPSLNQAYTPVLTRGVAEQKRQLDTIIKKLNPSSGRMYDYKKYMEQQRIALVPLADDLNQTTASQMQSYGKIIGSLNILQTRRAVYIREKQLALKEHISQMDELGKNIDIMIYDARILLEKREPAPLEKYTRLQARFSTLENIIAQKEKDAVALIKDVDRVLGRK